MFVRNQPQTIMSDEKHFLPVWVYLITHRTAHLRMPVTNAASTNADVLDAVEILLTNNKDVFCSPST